MHYGIKPGHFQKSNHTLSHDLRSELVNEPASEQTSAAERASERINGASALVFTSHFLAVLNHCAVRGQIARTHLMSELCQTNFKHLWVMD